MNQAAVLLLKLVASHTCTFSTLFRTRRKLTQTFDFYSTTNFISL